MADASAIKVTVVVPTHNTSDLVIRNIESMVAQTMPATDFEVIYVDDGSDDGTPDLIENVIAGRDNFTLIRSENSGWPGRPRNLGLAAARGEFVFFSDDDDWLEPDALEQLHARAVADGADIVIGRIAGHGRGSHRAIQESLTGGDIRRVEHAMLLRSMTVHKLFRRAFLEQHSLRFLEGKVRLEDHIFMLGAYLRTNRVSVVHDRTVYHWMRTTGSGNHSFGAVDPESYTSSIARLFAIIDEQIDDPDTRRRFVNAWYQRKILKHWRQLHFLDGTPEYADALVQANQKLVESWVPTAYDASQPQSLRIRAALLRRGDTDALRAWGRYERSMALRSEMRSGEWRDGRFVVRFSVEMRDGDDAPVVFRRETVDGQERIYRVLPPAYARDDLKAACDVTADLGGIVGRVMIRNRQPTGDVMVESTSSRVDHPAGDNQFTMSFDVEVAIDPMTADKGHPITGIWDVYATLDLCGHPGVRRLAAGPGLPKPLPSMRIPTGVAKPILTTSRNLSIAIGTVDGLATRLRRKARRGLGRVRRMWRGARGAATV